MTVIWVILKEIKRTSIFNLWTMTDFCERKKTFQTIHLVSLRDLEISCPRHLAKRQTSDWRIRIIGVRIYNEGKPEDKPPNARSRSQIKEAR